MEARPIRSVLLRELLFFAVILVPLAGALSWYGLEHVLRRHAEERAHDALGALATGIDSRLVRVDDAATTLATLWTENLVSPARPDEARAWLFPLLRQLPGRGTVMMVRPEDGVSYFAVRDAGTIRHQSLKPVDQTSSRTTLVVQDFDGRTQPKTERVIPYNPLRRPWIEQAMRNPDLLWSAPYAFAVLLNAEAGRGVGITRIARARKSGGAVQGYVGLDLPLGDFDRLCELLKPTPRSVVAVLDEEGRTLGSSQPGAVPLEKPGETQLPMVAEVLRTPAGLAGDAVRIVAQGEPWIARTAPLRSRGLSWRLALATPESDLLGPEREQVTLLVGSLLLLFAVAIVRTILLTRRISGGLSGLAAAAREVGRKGALEVPRADLAEIASVGEALLRSHHAIAAQQQLEQQLMHSQRVATAGFLAGGLAHDVNNQLTVLLGELAAARDEAGEGTPLDAQLELCERICWRSVEAMRGLVGLSRKGEPSLREIDLNGVVSETAALLERALDRGTRLQVTLAEALPRVLADPIQLEQVILNLALNARDAMPAGGELEIRTSLGGEGRPRLEVRDTGTGMTDEIRRRIFEPFFTTKEQGKGTGLGLAMVSNIVQQHGGTVTVESAPGKGTVFAVELPVRAAAA